MDICRFVDVFQGCGEINLPRPDGIAASWHFVKAISGNTTPAATLPFGKYSCCMYTTGYPTGYGENEGNYSPAALPKLKNGAKYFGLSHFHQSGTGAIDYYYNFAVTTAFYGDAPREDGYAIESESGKPGYYSVTAGGGIINEATVTGQSVLHRFTFPHKGGKIAVDFTNNGLFKYDKKYFRPDWGKITVVSDSEVRASVCHNGLTHHFVYRIEGAEFLCVTLNNEETGLKEVEFTGSEDVYRVIFKAADVSVRGRLCVSIVSAGHAASLAALPEKSFDEAREEAYRVWNELLSRIEIQTDSEKEKRIFYSNLYHSFVKPSDRSGESPFGNKDGFMADFSTMWDIYKTQLPLVFTLCGEESRKIMNTFLDFGKNTGKLPHMAVLKKDFLEPSSQACMLAEHSVCDAYYRSVDADYRQLFNVMLKDMDRDGYSYLYSPVLPQRLTHLADASEAAKAVCALADKLGEKVPEKTAALAKRQAECFDKETGLLKADFDYYEGNVWNYSFRLMNDMKQRIALAGGEEKFTQLLDRFFGYTHPESTDTRFEGFNNEPDIETPFCYSYVGRTDRVCEITDAMRKYMFTDGRGGIPGNNDSGGLSSCYVWYSLGIFPVTGQNLMLIGSPSYSEAVIRLANGKDFTVKRTGKGIYMKKAFLNGKQLDFPGFTVSDMMDGGVLELEMSEK